MKHAYRYHATFNNVPLIHVLSKVTSLAMPIYKCGPVKGSSAKRSHGTPFMATKSSSDLHGPIKDAKY